MNRLLCILMSVVLLLPAVSWASQPSRLETKLTEFIRQMYEEEDDVKVKYLNLPDRSEGIAVKGINFAKVPDNNGEGVALLETMENGRLKNIYVTFRVSLKKKLFVLKNSMRKGDVIQRSDLLVREAYLTGAHGAYPASINDVQGRILNKDLQAGTTLTTQLLEERHTVKKGEMVEIVARKKNLLIHAKGRALDKGKVGDTVRVKNLESGKEILAKVTAGNAVVVEF